MHNAFGQPNLYRLKAEENDSLLATKCIEVQDLLNGQIIYSQIPKSEGDTIVDGELIVAYPNWGAEFQGGDESFKEFVRNLLPVIKEPDLLGIYITFIVDTTGSIHNVCTISQQNNSNYYETEIHKIIESSPSWLPASVRGNKVCNRLFFVLK